MAIQITQPLNEVRLDALRQFLDQGSGNAQILIYSGTRPYSVNDLPNTITSTLLVTLNLDKPCGAVSNGMLELIHTNSDMAVEDGNPSWARVKAGNGQTAMDLDAGGPNPQGYWEIKLSSDSIYAGGYVLLESCQIT